MHTLEIRPYQPLFLIQPAEGLQVPLMNRTLQQETATCRYQKSFQEVDVLDLEAEKVLQKLFLQYLLSVFF